MGENRPETDAERLRELYLANRPGPDLSLRQHAERRRIRLYNLTAYYVTWYHKFSAASRWHSATESWYQYEKHTPNVNNPVGATLIETNANRRFAITIMK